MEISKPAQIRKPIPLTPLVDIVFLLLMFFMLSSTFTKFGRLDMGGQAGQNKAANTGGFPGVIVALKDADQVLVNGRVMALNNLAPSLNDYFSKGVRLSVLRTGSSASVQELVKALEIAHQSQITDIRVIE